LRLSARLQTSPDVTALREENAFPAEPEEGYGLEKLYAEKLCQYYMEDYGLSTRVVRFHNVYVRWAPMMGREKAVRRCAARSHARQIPARSRFGETAADRSFMYVDDCVEGIHRIMHRLSKASQLGRMSW